jgi:hypothetical protein
MIGDPTWLVAAAGFTYLIGIVARDRVRSPPSAPWASARP